MNSEKYNDVAMPKLGFGTWQLKDDLCVEAVGQALDVGYRHIDTAQIYGNEKEVGTAIKNADIPRSDIFLTTKIWLDNMKRDDVTASLEKSLQDLQTDYCDLVLVHWPHQEIGFDDTLSALADAQKAGKTRLIGVSNYTVDQVKTVRADMGFDIAVNQCEYHPFLDQSALIDQARDYGMIFTAYCPIAQGRVLKDPVMQDIATVHGKSPVQVTLRWLYQQDGVVSIPRSSNPDHIVNNFAIFDFALSDDDMARISALRDTNSRLINPDFAPAWDIAA
ncbi:MAG: aldo/keto reductase [Pseudomonadota bacterium]